MQRLKTPTMLRLAGHDHFLYSGLPLIILVSVTLDYFGPQFLFQKIRNLFPAKTLQVPIVFKTG